MARSIRSLKRQYVLNCTESVYQEDDWSFQDAIDAGVVDGNANTPSQKDLRASWWKVDDQKDTGACVGYATAYGLLRWLYAKHGLIKKNNKASNRPSARFIWMANKETDQLINYPTTFIETAGTQTKLALKVVRKYGCVMENVLPMSGKLSNLSSAAFYTQASRLRIQSFHNLGTNLDYWRFWIANEGPILTRLNVDQTWYLATANKGFLEEYRPNTAGGGHAVCLVGYDKDSFIVRNSWGQDWGDKGFAYASNKYTEEAFTEAYGAIL